MRQREADPSPPKKITRAAPFVSSNCYAIQTPDKLQVFSALATNNDYRRGRILGPKPKNRPNVHALYPQ
jgi:hypothetical protein